MPRTKAVVTPSPVAGTVSPEVETVLDAALALFADIGIRRATIGDIARRAGVDRVTVYRRVGSKDDVVAAVTTREATRLFDFVASAARRPATIEDRIATAFAMMIEQLRANAMLTRMMSLEPDTVLPQLTTDAMPLLATAVTATMQMFEQAVEDGVLESTDGMLPGAEVLVRVVHSYLLTPQALLRLESRRDLLAFARAHLVPMLALPRAGG